MYGHSRAQVEKTQSFEYLVDMKINEGVKQFTNFCTGWAHYPPLVFPYHSLTANFKPGMLQTKTQKTTSHSYLLIRVRLPHSKGAFEMALGVKLR